MSRILNWSKVEVQRRESMNGHERVEAEKGDTSTSANAHAGKKLDRLLYPFYHGASKTKSRSKPFPPTPVRLHDVSGRLLCSCACGHLLSNDAVAKGSFYIDRVHKERRRKARTEVASEPSNQNKLGVAKLRKEHALEEHRPSIDKSPDDVKRERQEKLEDEKRRLSARSEYLHRTGPQIPLSIWTTHQQGEEPVLTKKQIKAELLKQLKAGTLRQLRMPAIAKASSIPSNHLPPPIRLHDPCGRPMCSCECGSLLSEAAVLRNAYYVNDAHRKNRKRKWIASKSPL